MSNIVFCGISPHPPILLPEVGGRESEQVKETFRAMEQFARRLADSGAEVVVIISPHGAVFRDGIAINGSDVLAGNLRQFRADLEFEYTNDTDLVREIINRAAEAGVVTVEIDDGLAGEYDISTNLDHGVLVPVYFLDKAGIDLPMVSVSMGLLPFEELYAFGTAVRDAAAAQKKKVALIASGDMSHKLTPGAPAGYSELGAVFDREIVALLKDQNFKGIINIDRNTAEEAGECGLRPIIMMLGALDGTKVDVDVLSYEGPFGVGYMVTTLIPTGRERDSLLEQLFHDRKAKVDSRRAGESQFVALARQALESYVSDGKKLLPDTDGAPELQEKAGVFVSLKKHGELRGCIGTILPTTRDVAHEIVNNAISAGTGDPRFEPVEPDELQDLVYSVDILKTPESIDGMDQLDVKRYGVIVRSGHRSGLLLPNLEGVNTVEQQVAIARQKAGLSPDEPVQLERFEVIRYY